MLVPLGFARGRAEQMSKGLVSLAADLASFNNASPEETLEAMRSGLAGETEPLRRFGVFLSDARLKQEAMSRGLYDGRGALSASAKASATYALILRDSADAQGDFRRTSGSLANQQRVLRAQYADVTTELGRALLPAVQSGVRVLTELAGSSSAVGASVGVLAVSFVALRVAMIGAALPTAGAVILAAVGVLAALAILAACGARSASSSVQAPGSSATTSSSSPGSSSGPSAPRPSSSCGTSVGSGPRGARCSPRSAPSGGPSRRSSRTSPGGSWSASASSSSSSRAASA